MNFQTTLHELNDLRSAHRLAWNNRERRVIRDTSGDYMIKEGDQWVKYEFTDEDRAAEDWQPLRGWK